MNIEVEIKIKVNNLSEIRKKVAKLGKLIKSINQIDDYYVPSHRDFFAEKPQPFEWLRIRTNPDKVVFEYDKSINMKANGEQEYAEEYETEISEPEEFRKILGFLDFKKVVTVDKQREYWMCGDIEVALDRVKDLGDFIEAEAKGNFKSNAEAKIACIKFLESVGIKDVKKEWINKGYPVLMLENK
ncbi:MAG: class IV adenylate cyclase [Candidatus Staskawiczbacteria bacterium]|nr:class IV adenylate cyclase [Candidatus Staskawiczbacteria bacterium]